MAQQPEDRADYESSPITRPEYIAALVHLYRGELYRANSWRLRLDTTTNWAILTTAGLLSFTFSGQGHTHWVILMGLPLIFTLLGYEARRFRFFDVWRFRVRMLEENFYGPLLRRDPVSPERGWGEMVARDLLDPHFKMGLRAAIRARFTRNYWVIFVVLLVAWVVKVFQEPHTAHNWQQLRANLAASSPVWWLPLAYVGAVIAAMGVICFVFPRSDSNEQAYWQESSRRDVPDIDA